MGGGEDEDGNEIEGEEGDPDAARQVFERGYKELRKRGEKEDVSRHLRNGCRCKLTLSEHCCWKRGRTSRSNTVQKRNWQRYKR